MLETIFSSTSSPQSPFPYCVKYMFDFLDDQAREHGIVDPEVVSFCHCFLNHIQ